MLEGVLSVLCTPFHDDGQLDIPSLERLIEHNLSWGVSGVVCFGLAGEIYKLTDPERATVLDAAVAQVAGRVPVIAGTEHTSVEGAIQRTRWAEDAGADAVMVYPPTFVKPSADGVLEYYTALSASSSLSIIVQDAPAWTGISLPLELLSRIREHCPTVTHVKVEAPPTAPKLSQLPRYDLRPVGGYGALYLGEELAAGIDATMPGCAMPGLYVDIMTEHARGHADTAWSLYTDALPLLTFQMGGLDVFVAAQKLILHRIGVLSSTRLRRPGTALTAEQIAWLDRVIDHRGLSRYVGFEAG
jgi:2-keto-3-deoxy-L-arabinonate dehydratase